MLYDHRHCARRWNCKSKSSSDSSREDKRGKARVSLAFNSRLAGLDHDCEVPASIHSTHDPQTFNYSVTIIDTHGTRRALNRLVQVGEVTCHMMTSHRRFTPIPTNYCIQHLLCRRCHGSVFIGYATALSDSLTGSLLNQAPRVLQ
jgi:hypothetical protein